MKHKEVNRWDSDAFKSKKIAYRIADDLKNKLKIFPHPFNGWRSKPNQNLSTIKINENGLRSKSLSKLKFKKNAFLLGGSTAWGFGASSNINTPAYLIEDILLKKYNIKLNFINLADQMFSSYEELASFVNNVELLKPSVIVCLSGCNDINREVTEDYKVNSLYEKLLNFSLWGKKIGIFDEKNYFKKIIKIIFRDLKNEDYILSEYYTLKKPKKNKIAFTLTNEKFSLINSYCIINNIKCFHFLQPDLHFKKKKSESEKNYLKTNFSRKKSRLLISKYKNLKETFYKIKRKNIFSYSLLNIFDNDKSSIFFDRAHLTDKGYLKLSEIISKKISQNIK